MCKSSESGPTAEAKTETPAGEAETLAAEGVKVPWF